MTPDSSILYQNASQTVTLLDIPRSLELAQGLKFAKEKRIISSSPIRKPWTNLPEPKSAKAIAQLQPESIDDLLLRKHLEFALKEVKEIRKDRWCLQRAAGDGDEQRKGFKTASDEDDIAPATKEAMEDKVTAPVFFENNKNSTSFIHEDTFPSGFFVPPHSTYLQGSIMSSHQLLKSHQPKFDLVLLDPPWPNRSARRHGSYSVVPDISNLLSQLQLVDHLCDKALVGIWITNREFFRSLVLGEGGFFDQVNLELEEEWVWLKVTSFGEPIFSLGSRWRKPYEILLLGRKKAGPAVRWEGEGGRSGSGKEVKRRVIIAVPDLHSRKPNLKELVKPMLPGSYCALEVFARNLTEGWWGWGAEVCKFQAPQFWVESTDEVVLTRDAVLDL